MCPYSKCRAQLLLEMRKMLQFSARHVPLIQGSLSSFFPHTLDPSLSSEQVRQLMRVTRPSPRHALHSSLGDRVATPEPRQLSSNSVKYRWSTHVLILPMHHPKAQHTFTLAARHGSCTKISQRNYLVYTEHQVEQEGYSEVISIYRLYWRAGSSLNQLLQQG